MAEALTADTAELEAMGRAGAARVAERHNVAIEAKKLADLIAGPAAIYRLSRTPMPVPPLLMAAP